MLPMSPTHDMWKAFRQLSVRPEDAAYHIVAVYAPAEKRWQFGILDTPAFGLGAAVLEFNRVPALIVAIVRRWLAIPVVQFYGVFKVPILFEGRV